MLQSLSEAILHCREDAEECVNDSYVRAWNSMPENRPTYLGGYMAKITRNLSLNRLDRRKAEKRSAETVAFDELSECIPDGEGSDVWNDQRELSALLDTFLSSLGQEKRLIFMRRYFYGDSIDGIAAALGMKSVTVRTVLFRLRAELKKRFEEVGL